MYFIKRLIYMLKTPQYKVKLIRIIDEGQGTKTYLFNKPRKLNWQGGSNTHLAFPDGVTKLKPELKWTRHMSFQSIPDEECIGFTTRVPGSSSPFKERLSVLQPGETTTVFGSHCHMNLKRLNRPLIFISMGVGMATMRPMILEFAKDSSDIPEIYNIQVDKMTSNLFEKDLLSRDIDNLSLSYPKSRQELEKILEKTAHIKEGLFYIVGSDGFLKSVITNLRRHGISGKSILIDKYPPARKIYNLE